MTVPADEEAAEDGFGILDIESVVLTGSITERQRDRETGDWKYVVRGETLNDRRAAVVAKIGMTGRLFILTVYEDER